MCGIAGIVSTDPKYISEAPLHAAIDSLQHRGPLQKNFWKNSAGTVSFGHARLCILDLSAAAAQPMHWNDRYTIIYNGEVYNYIEIRTTLEQKGFRFQSQSDTEVVLAAYAAFGSSCVQYFDGMFSLAIWDEQEQIMFAARDRFGEKPFFFSYDESTLVFASEMKALWKLGVSKEVNNALLYNFLSIGYTSNPADPQETFFCNIKKLPASSYLIYSFQEKRLTIEKYWQVYPEVNTQMTSTEAVENFKQLFAASINKRLRSDVSIGTSLSGGLDSSSIVAFCENESSDQYTHKCFTASFEGFEKDETRYAAAVARRFNLQHFTTTISGTELPYLMDEVSYYQEEPFTSASILAQYKVYQCAKQNGVTVLLDGQGADEILAGYHKYYKWYWQNLFITNRKRFNSELQFAKNLGVKERFGFANKIAAFFPQFAASLLQGRKEKQAFKNPLLNREFAFAQKKNLYYSLPNDFDLNSALYYNTFVNGLEELLRMADRNSMAHTTEVRLPFLSHHLVEFLFSLPADFKIHAGWTKWLLRKSTEQILPPETVWRLDKVGFEPPQKRWMQNKTVQDAVQEGKRTLVANDILSKSTLEQPVSPNDAHAANNFDWRFWSASYLFR